MESGALHQETSVEEFDLYNARHWYFLGSYLRTRLQWSHDIRNHEAECGYEMVQKAMPTPEPRFCASFSCSSGPGASFSEIFLEARIRPWGPESPDYTLMECYAKCVVARSAHRSGVVATSFFALQGRLSTLSGGGGVKCHRVEFYNRRNVLLLHCVGTA